MGILIALVIFSAVVILVFGHRQFNQWTEAESKSEATEPELLAFAPPKSFTSFGRFAFVSALYSVTLLALYGVLFVLFYNPPLGADFLKVAGVTRDNAWLVSLFIVTGLSPILPVFSSIERSVREVMHVWAVVPGKAHQMAADIASPNTRFVLSQRSLEKVVAHEAGLLFAEDFTEGAASTIANKWARLSYLLCQYAPAEARGLAAPKFRSPYIMRFQQDLAALRKEVGELAAPGLLRSRPNSPATVALAERIDELLYRLYVLMSCCAFGSTRSWESAVKYLREAYGVNVVATQGASFPTDPVFDALAAVGLTVLLASVLFAALVPSAAERVNPFVWALSALCTHGLGVLIGWKTFLHRKRRQTAFLGPSPLSRKYLVAAGVLGYSCALVPTWLAALHYHELRQAPASYLQLAAIGFQAAWPWAILGAATAVVTYFHLARTANAPTTARIRLLSAGGQGILYIALVLLILAIHDPVQPVPLAVKLADPVVQLVLLLAGLIGVLLGLFLPPAMHGHGDDRRGGARRYDLSAQADSVVLTLAGRQVRGKLLQISMTGCAARFPRAATRQASGYGNLTLEDASVVPCVIAREIGEHGEMVDLAIGFSAERRFHYLPHNSRSRLQAYLTRPDLQLA